VAIAPLPFADRTRVANSIVIARQPDAVYAYVTTPANWPKWHPASLRVSGAIDHPLLPGEKVTEDYRVAGRSGQVVWTVAKRDVNREWVIEGEVDGQKAAVITYSLSPVAEGTRFQREFIYDSPNLLFSMFNRISIRERVEAESTQGVQNLKQQLEATR